MTSSIYQERMTSNPGIRETSHSLYKRQKDRGVYPSEASSHGAGFRAQATKQEPCAHTITRLGLNMANRKKIFFLRKSKRLEPKIGTSAERILFFFFQPEASSRRSITVQRPMIERQRAALAETDSMLLHRSVLKWHKSKSSIE